MAVTPTMMASKAPGALREVLANNAWFQSWTGSVDATAAKAHVLIGEYWNDESITRPFCVIRPGEFRVTVKGSGRRYYASGELELLAFADVSAAYEDDGENAMLEMLEAVGNLQDAIVSDASLTRWHFQNVRTGEGPVFADRGFGGSVKKYESWSVSLVVGWGTT